MVRVGDRARVRIASSWKMMKAWPVLVSLSFIRPG